MISTDTWTSILADDEEILWQGRPDGAIAPTLSDFCHLFVVLSLTASRYPHSNTWSWTHLWPPTVFGFLLGTLAALVTFRILWLAFLRKRSRYALTNKRALISIQLPFRDRRVTSFPVGEWVSLTVSDKPMANLYFSTRKVLSLIPRFRNAPVGFERITEGREVYKMMREFQAKAKGAVT